MLPIMTVTALSSDLSTANDMQMHVYLLISLCYIGQEQPCQYAKPVQDRTEHKTLTAVSD